jgi:hypothetical protein
MSPTATAVISPENVLHVADSNRSGAVSPVSISTGSKTVAASDDLNVALAQIVQSVTDRSESAESKIITVDLVKGENVQEFSTRLRMLLLFMNRNEGSVSATVSPSFQDDTYPAMLALVKGFQSSGASEDWHPDGPRSIRVGNARHLFVSVDMPVMDRSPAPDTLIELVSAHKISSSWYDQRVSPRVASIGITTLMFGIPNSPGSDYAGSVFKRERTRNLSVRSGGIHLSRQLNWSASAAV